MNILVDLREKKPWDFRIIREIHPEAEFTVERSVLRTGDYSLRGMEESCAIERKSIKDFINTLSQNQYRFYAELSRMNAMTTAVIVVESPLETFTKGRKSIHDILRMSGDENHFMQKMMTIKIAFPRIEWFFAENKAQAEYYTFRRLAAALATDHGHLS